MSVARFAAFAKFGVWALGLLIFLAVPNLALAQQSNANEAEPKKRPTVVLLLRADGGSSPPAIQGTPKQNQKVINPFDPDDLRDFVNDIREARRAPEPPAADIVCAPNEVPEGLNCVCDDGFERDGEDVCQPVAADPICGPNEVFGEAGCVCADGFEPDGDGGCLPVLACGVNEIESGGICVCAGGFEPFEGNCVAECGPAEIRNVDGVCEPILVCGANEVESGGICICEAGFERFQGNCVPQCEPGTERDAAGICQDVGPVFCPVGNDLPEGPDGCVCPPGTGPHTDIRNVCQVF